MCVIDDPMLALIARFVVEDIDNLSISDEIFLQHQVAEIGSYIEDAPSNQRLSSNIKDIFPGQPL